MEVESILRGTLDGLLRTSLPGTRGLARCRDLYCWRSSRRMWFSSPLWQCDARWLSGCRHGLQRKASARAANQNIGAAAKSRFRCRRRCRHIRRRATLRADGGCKNGPGKGAPRRKANVKSSRIDCAIIALRRFRRVRREAALHRLMACNNKTYAWIEPAIERPHLRPCRAVHKFLV
jgi:hypothetical protein